MINQPPQQNAPVIGQEEDEKKKRRGTGFANISKILQANVGAGQRIGQTIGGNITQQAQAVREGIQAGKQQFQAGQQAATQKAGETIGAAQGLVRGETESEADYAKRVSEAQNVGQIGQSLKQLQYTGPRGLEGQEQLESRALGTQQLSNLISSGAAGQDILLRNIVAGRGGYTRGQSALDRLLLRKEGQQQLQEARTAGADLTQQVRSEAELAKNLADLKERQIEQTKNKIFEDVAKTLGTPLASEGILGRATEAGKKAAEDALRLHKLLTTETRDLTDLSASDLELLDTFKNIGLEKEIFTGDPALLQTTLNNLASGLITQQPGAKKFQENEQKAAANLARFLGDEQTASAIEKNIFQEDILEETERMFDPSRTALSSAEQELTRRQQNVDILNSIRDTAAARYYSLNPQNRQYLQNPTGINMQDPKSFITPGIETNLGDQNDIFEPLERVMPGVRAQVDADPYSVLGLDWRQWDVNSNRGKRWKKELQKLAYNKIASDPNTLANLQNQYRQQQDFINSNTKSVFDVLKEKISSKLPKKETT